MTQRIIMSLALVLATGGVAAAQEMGGEVATEGSVTPTETTPTETSSETPAVSESTGGEHGPLGFGAGSTLSGISALDVAYHLGDKLIIEGILGFVIISPDMGDSTTALAVGAGGHWQLFDFGMVDMYIGGRLLLSTGSVAGTSPGLVVDVTQTFIEFPAQVRVQLNKHLAVHFETGLGLGFGSEDAGGTSTDTFNFFLGAGELFGSGGFTVYL